MNKRDKALGMQREITRRDFVQGAGAAGLAGAAALAPGCPFAAGAAGPGGAATNADAADNKTANAKTRGKASQALRPAQKTGLRGSHQGAFEVAHEMAFDNRVDWGTPRVLDERDYDLVVVGAGVSGLAAAYFYQQQHPGARILLLENHDDFGGHAKRNEFNVDGRQLIGYGGSQSFENPRAYSDTVKGLFKSLGIKPAKLADAYDQAFYKRHNLEAALYFSKSQFGRDRLVKGPFVDTGAFVPLAPSTAGIEQAVKQMPISAAAQAQMLELFTADDDRLPDHSVFSEPGVLSGISYQDFLTNHLGVTEPEVLRVLQDMPSGYFGHGIDTIPAMMALGFGLPGLNRTSLGSLEPLLRRLISWGVEPYVYHFPDGNASVARMLVRALIPGAAAGDSMEDVVQARFAYNRLDDAAADVRLRLHSTVVNVVHAADKQRVHVTYVRGGRAEAVRTRHVVLACYNMAIPYLCPELPAAQRTALSSLVKMPLVYTNVALRNWRAFAELGVGMLLNPGCWHQMAVLDFPVSMGGVKFSPDPSQPILLHMSRAATVPGLKPQDQSRTGRYQLLTTEFADIERSIREQLAGALSGGGFDPGRDIAGITVNRWPHGYAFTPNELFDPDYAEGEMPYELGRQTFGRIAIANSDAGGRAYLDEAIDQGFRAVSELPA